ncbi:hypothetical protein [Oceanirhabdus sp. W0125-5]|nr:hypothetical protein [Oceanirhabdus sp. W0125-5]WBW97664.1 hypothetical protein OW730_02480 [Oceanirhabdus sp. W0125-5]
MKFTFLMMSILFLGIGIFRFKRSSLLLSILPFIVSIISLGGFLYLYTK